MAFFCINCKSPTDPNYKACPFCGEPITDFLRRHLENPIDGKYKILSRLGIGGMGEVYKVLHLHLNAARVVKLMRPAISQDNDAHERFIREARLATRIQHPSVATLFDFSSMPDGSFYMVWEYIEGMNLADLVRARGRLSPRYATELAIQVLHGLEAIHRSGVVHRDVSPENVMITRDDEGHERVKIIDLGIAKQSDSSDEKTKTGMFVGKWKYCSPEQLGMLKGEERIDARADLYSFGIVLYEMITGVPPFIADSPHRYLLAHATETPKPFATTQPGVECPPELEAMIFRSLEKDRDKRFASARQFAGALEAILPLLPAAPAMEAQPSGPATTIESELIAKTLVTLDGAASPTLITREAILEPKAKSDVPPHDRTLVGTPAETLQPRKNRSPLLFGGGAIIAVIIAIVLTMSGKKAPPLAVASKPDLAGIVTPAQASLGLNAFPWAEVTRVRNVKSGETIDVTNLVTPARLALPAGDYEITLRNPDFKGEMIERVAVDAGGHRDVTVQFTDAALGDMPSFVGDDQ